MMLKSMAQNESASSAAPEEATAQASKIIRTVNFTIRTQQYDAAYAALSTLVLNLLAGRYVRKTFCMISFRCSYTVNLLNQYNNSWYSIHQSSPKEKRKIPYQR